MDNLDSLFLELKNKLDQSKNILITMSSPDGDSIGSSLALFNVINSLEKNVSIQSSFPIPDYLKFVPDIKKVKIDDIGKFNFSSVDFVIVVDSSGAFRVVEFNIYGNTWDFPENTFVVSFDHHQTHINGFADIDIFDEKSSSSCELVYKFVKNSNITIDSKTATLLFLGLYTDTGGFIHDNVTSDTYTTASDLLRLGADKHFIIKNLDRPYNFKSLQFLKIAIDNTEIIRQKDFAYVLTILKQEDIKNIEENILENTTNILKGNPGFIKNIENTDFGVLIKEEIDEVKVSFRENDDRFDLSLIAKTFGGGGHKKACAYASKKSLNEVLNELKEEINKQCS